MRYKSLSGHLLKRFGERVHKIAIDAGMSCPNRDGTISRQGCFFCNRLGSGTGALMTECLSIGEQISRAIQRIETRFKARKFISYLQSFSNTYAPLPVLKAIYEEALSNKAVVGLSVATRPDCLNYQILELLGNYGKNKMVWLELGLQSAHDVTLKKINRGHDVACFSKAVEKARDFGLSICAHVILGLPGETREMMLETARFLSSLQVEGVKIHLLYVLKGTPFASWYAHGKFKCLERHEYVELVVDFIELLRKDIIIHRLTGDPPPGELIAPGWALDKSATLRLVQECLERRDTWQGKRLMTFSAGR
ncbi:MAG: TIGR01212 family radical SAM protein [Desulfobacteraceae bacterium]|nr:MAG: TIGR01212 family radical SAM protein [Desulfobacteraceae bacterium]